MLCCAAVTRASAAVNTLVIASHAFVIVAAVCRDTLLQWQLHRITIMAVFGSGQAH
jgi:hypothetical protein